MLRSEMKESLMFMYNLKFTLRTLRRDGFYSIINIAGLSIGMAAAILLFVWVYNEWSYDRFHKNEKQLYGAWSRAEYNGQLKCWNWTSALLGPAVKENYPEIIETTRVSFNKNYLMFEDKKLNMVVAFVDPGFMNMFSFPLIHGNQETALNEINSLILTETASKRLFGNEDPMNKDVTFEIKHSVTVTGIMKNLPQNTCFEFDALIPITFYKSLGELNENWENNTLRTFVQLHPDADVENINRDICNIIKEHTNNQNPIETFLYPLNKSHLYSKFENGKPTGGRIDMLRIFSLIAVLILLIACINFMNLSTARSEKRTKEVGVRKVMGGKRPSLILQFMGESLVVSLIAGFIALFVAWLLMPAYSSLIGKTLNMDLANGWFWLCALAFILFTALLAGSYPAFYLSSFQPIKVIKRTFKREKTLITPRKLLVIVQFTFAIFLIIATLIINRQIRYAQSRDNGYNKDQLIYHAFQEDIEKNYELIRNELLSSGVAVSVTRTSAPMTEGWNTTMGIEWKGSNPNNQIMMDIYFVDSDWIKTTGAVLLQGRDIDIHTYSTDANALILNESAEKIMNFDNPIGQTVRLWGQDWHVVGVVKDFILHSPYSETVPMLIGGPGGFFNTIHIKLNGTNRMSDNLKKAEKIFRKYNPNYPFEYKFVDEEYAHKFEEENTLNTLATGFTILTIFISCLGLFALVAYMAETRRKEIGIRKVLGASVRKIVTLLSKEFLILVIYSIFIASPIAWWAMNKWLSGYAYHTNIPWWMFIGVGFLGIGIAILTVSWQAIKAATANPVKSIKTE